jgi:poly(3-hydroxybutyrate) depolymerase
MKFFLIIFTLFAQSLLADNMKELSFLYDNIDRYYLLNLPENHNKDKPINLVIGLHGYTGTASGF